MTLAITPEEMRDLVEGGAAVRARGGDVELTDGDFLWSRSAPTEEDGDAGDDDGFLIPAET